MLLSHDCLGQGIFDLRMGVPAVMASCDYPWRAAKIQAVGKRVTNNFVSWLEVGGLLSLLGVLLGGLSVN